MYVYFYLHSPEKKILDEIRKWCKFKKSKNLVLRLLFFFLQVGVCTLWSIRLVVFVNQDLKHMISHVQQSSVKTGIANALGNIFCTTGN